MFEPTRSRAPRHTDNAINRRIRIMTECSVARYAAEPNGEIDKRIHELEREWDVERTLEANAAFFSLAGVVLSIRVSKKWLILPALSASFLLQHALHGWCPPVPVFRRFGIRTEAEINAERSALKLLRGDFRDAERFQSASHLVEAAAR